MGWFMWGKGLFHVGKGVVSGGGLDSSRGGGLIQVGGWGGSGSGVIEGVVKFSCGWRLTELFCNLSKFRFLFRLARIIGLQNETSCKTLLDAKQKKRRKK